MWAEVDHVLDTVIDCQRAERLRPFSVAAARATDNDQLQSIMASGIAPRQLGDGLDQHIGRLQRLNTPTNKITWMSWATPNWARDLGWSQGWKMCRSTPGGRS